jgi:2-keto-4-pentenoate hydratase/2-oxohepta-3-ene-1,7-dioic acid hydratase in catechol pathway
MIFSLAEQIVHISRTVTLQPGDVIATGTPAGVGAGRDPQVWLQDGDVVEVEIGDVGVLRNPVSRPTG